LPPGPRMPSTLQLVGTWTRPTAFLERCRARYGKRFTLRFPVQPPFVVLSDPGEIKELFTAPADVLHPGEGAQLLEPIVGANSVILLDEQPHLEQRRLMLPAFHGERMEGLASLMRDLAEEEMASWQVDGEGREIELHSRLQRLTLEIILRTVFGLRRGSRLEELRGLLTASLGFTENPLSLIPLPAGSPLTAALSRVGPLGRLAKLTARADALIFALIDERRRTGDEGGTDVLSLLLAARHEDGSPMSPQELRDELMTALVAGHETTASQLAWAFAELAHAPAVQERIAEESRRGEGEECLTATINEVMRRRPVLPNAEPRLVKKPVRIGGFAYEPGVVLTANAHLVHHDPEIYPEPYVFRPERFLGRQPGTYTWLPFGGGRRRCLGASFALMEMRVVLASALSRFRVEPAAERPEPPRRRSITISPARGAHVVLRTRTGARRAPDGEPAVNGGGRAAALRLASA
ncbi:MAG: cytochrome P450, partial [Acidobacteriota bacterium]|nr:cytochrome P450 [Acidobacteriota bacterium]